MRPDLHELTAALQRAWCAESSSWRDAWPLDNPARGQCIASSLVVQDYYSGELIRFAVEGAGIKENHYCNLLEDGTLLDTTRPQYKTPVSMCENPVDLKTFPSLRAKLLDDDEISGQYNILRNRVRLALAA